jgi:hypothetical protein
LKLQIARIALSEPATNCQSFLISATSPCDIACTELQVAETVQAEREVALPFGVIGLSLGDAPSKRQPLLHSGAPSSSVIRLALSVCNFIQYDRRFQWPLRVHGIALGQATQNRQGFLVCSDGARIVALQQFYPSNSA